jgi:hypothetical protein
MLALTLAATALLSGCATTTVDAAGRLAGVEIIDRSDGRVLPIYVKDGQNWVVGMPGREYAVRVRNQTGGRVLAVTSVDGINVVSGETASPAQSGYVLDRGGSLDIEGWRKSLARTAAFYFTELPDAYATRTGRPDNVGVIGVAIFRERPQPVTLDSRVGKLAAEPSRDATAPSSMPAPASPPAESRMKQDSANVREEAAAGGFARAPSIGTGHGRSEDSRATVVRFERESPQPSETITIRYDRLENLVAMGIVPPPSIARSPQPNAFPAWTPKFVPDPPRY